MTKIKFSKNFFVTKINFVLQCNLEHVYDALLVNGYGTATTKKENIGKIFAVACRMPCSTVVAELPVFAVSVSVSVLFTANA